MRLRILVALLLTLGLWCAAQATMLSPIVDFGKPRGGASPTWDPANKSSALTLSNGNLTATQSASNANTVSVRSTTSHSTGKFYLEDTHVYSASAAVVFGFGTSAAPVSSLGYQIGQTDNNSVGVNFNAAYYYRGSTTTDWSACASGVVAQLAIDIGSQLIWAACSGGNWNNSALNNPATGIGGFSISPSLSGALFIMATTFNIGDSSTLNTCAVSCSFTAPVGFGNW